MRDTTGDSTFNPDVDKLKKFLPGTFPAYISGFEYYQPEGNDSKVCRYTFKLAQETGTITVTDPETGEEMPATHMVGKEFTLGKDASVWLCEEPAEGDGWKNGKYIEFHEDCLGLKFPRKTVEGVEIIQVQAVEEEDVIGIPVWVETKDELASNGKSYMKVQKVKLWTDVEKKTKEQLEEDNLPF